MKKIKSVVLLTLAAVICLCFAACGEFKGYDDDDAIAKSSSFSSTYSVESKLLSSYSLSANKANGVKRIKDIKIPKDPEFDLTLTLEGGRCKIVLVKDKKVYKVCEGFTAGPVTLTLEAGTYSLRLVAESAAKVKFTFKYDGYGG
ncbi:MAG: hypothetical protein FWD58_05250 [Firmicutes bacterium]|nr:hypothetical protein [Bacillota bacterium]